MEKKFLLYTSYTLIFFSTICFTLNVFDINNIFLLNAGFILGAICGLILVICNLLMQNFNLMELGSGSYLSFAFGGFVYSIYSDGLDYIFYQFNLWGHIFDKIDICYAGIYSNIFCFILIFFGNLFKANTKIISYYIKNINQGIYQYKNELFIYLLLLICLKMYLILSGQITFSFVVSEETKKGYGDSGAALAYFVNAISCSSIFINSLLLFSKVINKKFLSFCLISDIIYIFALGRRPLIYHFMIFIMGFCTINNIKGKAIQLKNNNQIVKNIIIIIIFVYIMIILLKFISFFRISFLAENSLATKNIVEIFYEEFMTGRIWDSVFGGQEDVEAAFNENVSIRNAFTIAYLAHLIHGLFEYQTFAGGQILISSIVQILPSINGITDKSGNLQGEEIISDIVKHEVGDGANTILAYSLADFSVLGSLVYVIILSMINFLFLNIVKNNADKSVLLLTIAFSCISYSYMGCNENSLTDLLLMIRSVVSVCLLYKFIKLLIVNKKNLDVRKN